MKRIDAVIRPERLEQVKSLLSGIDIQGATAAEVRGFGRQRGHTEMYRGTEYSVDFLPKIHLTIVAADERVQQIVDAIIQGSRTGKMGDGKIFVTPVDEAIRIRTGERGPAAL
ncbi:MAG: P-II family nitrogen regulator [Terracidiphilus sp.]|jgi:nitrogen regulatory protein P-II 1